MTTRHSSREVWTIKRVIDWSTSYLQKHEIDAPRLTTELLLSKVLDFSRVQLYLHFDKPLVADELAAFKAFIKRRIKHEPTQYILGTQSFWTLDFHVDPRVLIPRPETECIVEECLRLFKQGELPINDSFLDLCTGSSALASALAVEFPEATIDATDISEDALKVAKRNLEANDLQERVQLHQGNLFEAVPEKQYAAIVSNPPYVRSDEMPDLQAEVQLFEPHLALDGGEDGLALVQVILRQAPAFLKSGGALLIEIGSAQGKAAVQLAESLNVYEKSYILRDYSDLDRVLCCRLT